MKNIALAILAVGMMYFSHDASIRGMKKHDVIGYGLIGAAAIGVFVL